MAERRMIRGPLSEGERTSRGHGNTGAVDPKRAWAFNDRGFAYYLKRDPDSAFADFEQVIFALGLSVQRSFPRS